MATVDQERSELLVRDGEGEFALEFCANNDCRHEDSQSLEICNKMSELSRLEKVCLTCFPCLA